MSHLAYKPPPLHFVLREKREGGGEGGGVFVGHYGISHNCGGFKLCRVEALFKEISARACFMMDDCMPSG